ncbi:hypothetical protein J2Z23_004148 [Lederbergia galactosidilyticus]|nr:hypothetical protein [Lederbergia galactosidilytica]
MNAFYSALNYVNRMIYEPNNLTVKSIQEEKQNSKYSAGTFRLSSRTVRFRVANITPTKVGQFVAFWEKQMMVSLDNLFFQKKFFSNRIFLGPVQQRGKWQ